MRRLVWGIVFFVLFVAACSPRYGTPVESTPASGTEKPGGDDARGETILSGYYDFKDILIPREMKLDSKDSLLIETGKRKAGRICFKGRMDPLELFDFFVLNMPKDRWALRSYFKYGAYLLVFEKPDRDCILSIHEESFNTKLEIWVTPRLVEE